MYERVLVVGLGSIGQRHLRLLRERLPDARIMALRHSSCENLPDGIDACTTSLEEAVSFAPDVAIIATPAPYHYEAAIALAQAGTHLLIEKPLAVNAIEGKELAQAAATGVVLQVGYNLRFLDSLRQFRTMLQAGRIGRVVSVRAEVGHYLPDWRPESDWRNTVSARAELGGGVLLELSHELDFLRWIFGEVGAVRSWMGRQGALELDVEDTVHALLEFAAPTPRDAKGVPPVASVSLDFIRRDTVRQCVAIGEDATLRWDAVSSEVRLTLPSGEDEVLYTTRPDRDASYIAQIDAFLEATRTGTGDAANAVDGIAVLQIADAIRMSHAAGGVEQALGALKGTF